MVKYCKENKISFYGGMSYYVLKSFSQIDTLYYGYGKSNNEMMIYKYEKLAMTATVIDKNQELNFTRYVRYTEEFYDFISEFCSACHDASNGIPWVSFSNFKDAIDFGKKNSKSKVC